jgi:hypothetical protein
MVQMRLYKHSLSKQEQAVSSVASRASVRDSIDEFQSVYGSRVGSVDFRQQYGSNFSSSGQFQPPIQAKPSFRGLSNFLRLESQSPIESNTLQAKDETVLMQADVLKEDDQAQTIIESALTGVLRSDQIELDHTPFLGKINVNHLQKQLSSIRNPAAQPIPDALKHGEARIEEGKIRMYGIHGSSVPEKVANEVASLKPKATRIFPQLEGFKLQIQLNPWISIATGTPLLGLDPPSSPLLDGTIHPTEPDVVWSNDDSSPFTIDLPDYNSDEDPDWWPDDGLREAFEAGPTTPMEGIAATMSGTTRTQTGAGMVTSSRGWGGQPRISSRASDYGGATAPSDYPRLATILDASGDIEQLASSMLSASSGEDADFSRYSDETRRAVAMTLGITQIAEEHPRRTPGSALLGRAAFQAVEDGTHTFREAMSSLPYAPKGGTKAMKDIRAGKKTMTDKQLEIASLVPPSDESCGIEYKRKQWFGNKHPDPDDDDHMIC